ncbi:MAG TPA: hypothetical protein P5346_11590 [Spirochaetota bacterium]|nr:hypothetical protein [Spirochaetota bacterium]HSA15373.1 hypothetical protein [Spirochaetota bacterium]
MKKVLFLILPLLIPLTYLECDYEHNMVCCETYGLGADLEKCCETYESVEKEECSGTIDGGGKQVVDDSYCAID